jgi:hypothetical protein
VFTWPLTSSVKLPAAAPAVSVMAAATTRSVVLSGRENSFSPSVDLAPVRSST